MLLIADQDIDLASHADTAGRLLLGADLAVILFPYMVFVCLAAAFSAACQVLGRFTEPALSPIWLNLAILSALGGGAIVGNTGCAPIPGSVAAVIKSSNSFVANRALTFRRTNDIEIANFGC